MIVKRLFDIVFSILALLLLGWLIILLFVLCSLDNLSYGFFLQKRIGQYGKTFTIIKLKTVRPRSRTISFTGRLLRKTKLDELPQLINVLTGDMSFVGPRPDIPGYYDRLEGEQRKILELKPGITGPASIKYSNEEAILAEQQDPLKYNDEIIFPDKVRLNLQYYKERSFLGDITLIVRTFLKFFHR